MIRRILFSKRSLPFQLRLFSNFTPVPLLSAGTRQESRSLPLSAPFGRTEAVKFPQSFVRYQHQDSRRDIETATVTEKAQNLFKEVWDNIQRRYGTNLVIPREIVWLNGAPGSGKGANTHFILKSRGLGRAVSMSEVLSSRADSRSYMDRGELIPEKIVVESLLSEIFDPVKNDGVGMIIDGYPRTQIQVDMLKLLHDRVMELYKERKAQMTGFVLPKPAFKIVVLHVDEETSIRRQLMRGLKEFEKTKRAQDAGADMLGVVDEVRPTDLQEEQCLKRYQIFKAHYGTLLRLKSFFPFHLIDAVGNLQDTKRQILRELRYQSSTDLELETYKAIRHLPMAKELVKLSRMQLTAKLDTYALSNSELFKSVIQIIDHMILPILKRSGLSGEAYFVTRNPLFTKKLLTIDILTDILSDRGYHVSYWPEISQIPTKFDVQTGTIATESLITHHFKIKFLVSSVRDLNDGLLTSDGPPSDTEGGATSEISTSFMPEGADHQAKYGGNASRASLVTHYLTHDLEYHQESLQLEEDIQPQSFSSSEVSEKSKETEVCVHRLQSQHKHVS